MSQTKTPFKSNVDQPIGWARAKRTGKTVRRRRTKGGIWLRTSKNKPLRATVVDKKKDRIELLKWTLKWVITLPLAAYLMVWVYLFISDLWAY